MLPESRCIASPHIATFSLPSLRLACTPHATVAPARHFRANTGCVCACVRACVCLSVGYGPFAPPCSRRARAQGVGEGAHDCSARHARSSVCLGATCCMLYGATCLLEEREGLVDVLRLLQQRACTAACRTSRKDTWRTTARHVPRRTLQRRAVPFESVLATRSEPARSTRFSLEYTTY